MDIKNMTREFGVTLESFFGAIAHRVERFAYIKQLIFFALFVLVCVLGFYSYSLYQKRQEQGALLELNRRINDFYKVSDLKNSSFEKLIESFQKSHNDYRSAKIAPFFNMYQVNLLLKEEKYQQALELMEIVVAELQGTELSRFAQIKYALMLLDSAQVSDQDKGKSLLIELVQDLNNPLRDMAAYYLGRYYLVAGNAEGARQIWLELINSFGSEETSPWASLVHQKLESLV